MNSSLMSKGVMRSGSQRPCLVSRRAVASWGFGEGDLPDFRCWPTSEWPQTGQNRRIRALLMNVNDDANNSTKRSEVADGVARQSEGIAQVSLLCSVRQGAPRRRDGIRL